MRAVLQRMPSLIFLSCLAFPALSLQCAVALKGELEGDFDYVCDETEPWLHYSSAEGWGYDMGKLPPEGTGCHSYVALSGSVPSGCQTGRACIACANPPGTTVSSVFLHAGSCTPCMPNTRRRSKEMSRRHHKPQKDSELEKMVRHRSKSRDAEL